MIVYLLRIVDTDYFKVGISADLFQRLNDIQAGMPMPITLIHSFEQDDAREVERTIHQILDKYRVRGEWFHVDADVAAQAFMAGNTMGMVDAALDEPGVEPEPDEVFQPINNIPNLFPRQRLLRDRIIDWLWHNPWQPSSVIAVGVGATTQVIQTKIIDLVKTNQLYRRPTQNSERTEKYEYAVVAQVLADVASVQPSTVNSEE